MQGTASLAAGFALGLVPVTAFLLSLLYLDSYKLVRLKTIVQLLAAGGVAAGLSYFVNVPVLERPGADTRLMTILVTPLVEELIKAIPLILMFRAKRIGFLVDAAIVGFAIGAGFALVENVYYVIALPDASPALWAIRGFGTGIMHGGSTAILGMALKILESKGSRSSLLYAIPGLLMAYLIHAFFNSFLVPPMVSALILIVAFPPLVIVVFSQSEKALHAWLDRGFDLDAELIATIHSGEFVDSPIGNYLQSLREHFEGPVLADMLCYVRLHAEVALTAKGLLMMRESGFQVRRDPSLDDKLQELGYLKQSIGKTGELAIGPIVHSSDEDIWQLQLLDGLTTRGS